MTQINKSYIKKLRKRADEIEGQIEEAAKEIVSNCPMYMDDTGFSYLAWVSLIEEVLRSGFSTNSSTIPLRLDTCTKNPASHDEILADIYKPYIKHLANFGIKIKTTVTDHKNRAYAITLST